MTDQQELQGRPVPRIEFVHRAHVLVDGAELTVPQLWHVRYIGGNGEPLSVNALAMGHLFVPGDLAIEESFVGGITAIAGASGRVPVLVVEAGDES